MLVLTVVDPGALGSSGVMVERPQGVITSVGFRKYQNCRRAVVLGSSGVMVERPQGVITSVGFRKYQNHCPSTTFQVLVKGIVAGIWLLCQRYSPWQFSRTVAFVKLSV